uniref:DUF1640 domain-containing protein n=1 Tax=Candidatus Kentrum sp. FW TaxID=2126338 RepID=A0A450SSW4_9GAMM|nr:MAG: hypothetical protein BECKFW1821A_GA0114235_106810 [Candidatus Kentron sp. FW]VFJ64349.1 MAG: hypothetical protein BECKFW1821B_GA0114236_109310 [Candidatus Kentron sp. FW]VFJ72968.1 MAG: hypothetical protein BECKFW1821C_GA0114237_104125 [Candidatus Kentron sp. FW]
MDMITFNTLKFVRKLEGAGVPKQQAEVQAQALEEALSTATQGLATKTDIDEAKSEFKTEMRMVENRLDNKITILDGRITALDSKLDSIRWVLLLIAVILIAPLFKTLL